MNAVVKAEPSAPRSVIVSMAERYGMEAAAFEATVRATVCKGNVSREEFAAFLLVAKEHRLNPLTKEIYAFPAKGGGIQPIVSIDGWARIINEHPMLDGIEFKDTMGEDGVLVAIECLLYRKDRSRAICVTEYMAECRRPTDVWKQWPSRMLRHKALIQAARYAFGFSGIVDPDEYERMVSPPPKPTTQRLHAGFDEPAPPEGSPARLSEPRAADAEFVEQPEPAATPAASAPPQEADPATSEDAGLNLLRAHLKTARTWLNAKQALKTFRKGAETPALDTIALGFVWTRMQELREEGADKTDFVSDPLLFEAWLASWPDADAVRGNWAIVQQDKAFEKLPEEDQARIAQRVDEALADDAPPA